MLCQNKRLKVRRLFDGCADHRDREIGFEGGCKCRDRRDRIILRCRWLDSLICPLVILRLNGKRLGDSVQRPRVRIYRPEKLGGRREHRPLLADRLYLLSIVGGLIRTTFLQSFLLSGYRPASYSRLLVSITPKYSWESDAQSTPERFLYAKSLIIILHQLRLGSYRIRHPVS